MTANLRKNEEVELSRFYSKDNILMAVVSVDLDQKYVVDFYKDEVMVDSRTLDNSVRYAEDLAENFVEGIIRLDPKTWRLHGV